MKKFLEYFGVYALAVGFFAIYQFQTDFLDTDGYYHIKIAAVMREQGFLSNFKWAHLSLWREHFSDKEFLYHVYLMPFTFFDNLMFGAKLATVLLAGAVATSFYAVMRLNNIRFAGFWLLLLFVSGGYFLYRINVARPQVLSVLLTLWTIHFIINRKLIALGILCFIYTFSYTAYHIPVMLACIVYGYLLVFEKENDWKLPAVTLGGMIAGMLLSPFLPDNLLMFYMQNFYIPWMAGGSNIDLGMGGEFHPMDTRQAFLVNTAVILPFLGAFFTALFAPRQMDRKTVSLFLIALLFILFTMLSKRFAEYSVPVTLLFCAFFFSPYWDYLFQIPQLWKKAAIGAGALLVLVVLGVNSYGSTAKNYKGMDPPVLESCAKYLLEHTNDDEIVFTTDWDEAPELFFFNHKNRYLVFLDPAFMYGWDPKVWQKWRDISRGEYGDRTFNILKDEFKIRYGVGYRRQFPRFRDIVERDKRMKIVHDAGAAYVFKLNYDWTGEEPSFVESNFISPKLDEVIEYFIEVKHLPLDEAKRKGRRFYKYHESLGWEEEGVQQDWKKEADRSLDWED